LRTFSLDAVAICDSECYRLPDPGCRIPGSGQHCRRLFTGKQKNYLHFLYIARGSPSEAQYFIHLARRFGYLSDVDLLAEQTKRTFACLHGLIRSVEEEAGKITTVVASVTSLLVLSVIRFANGPGVATSMLS